MRLLSRNGNDLGKRFPAIVASLAKAIPHGSVVDGELVALDADGKPNFNLIQNSATSGATLVFFAFDLLALAGADLTRKPLSERQALLSKALQQDARFSSRTPSISPPSRCLKSKPRSGGCRGHEAFQLL